MPMISGISDHVDRGFLAGPGEMQARVREKDWSRTSLGPIERWSPSMRALVATTLDSRIPTMVYLGPELLALYNDAYRPLLGVKPEVLGHPFDEVWSEALDTTRPQAQRALAGESVYERDAPFTLLRNGQPKQAWFDYSFSPLRDESGAVIGLINICIETTTQVVLQRRQSFLLALGDAFAELTAPREMMATAARMLGETLRTNRALYAEFGEDNTFVIHDDYREGAASMTGVHSILDFPYLCEEYQAGRTVVHHDAARAPSLRVAERSVLASLEAAAYVAVPLVRRGRLVAVLAVHASTPRAWTDDEVKLVEETARRTWDVVERARAEDALRESSESYRTLCLSSDQGFCTLDMIFDAHGDPIDYRFVEINPAFERQTGLINPTGKTARELVPDLDAAWFRIYGEVARTGQSIRFENHAPAMDRWFDVFAFRIGGPGSRRIALIFKDITKGRQATEALRRSEARLQLALDAARLGSWEWEIPTEAISWSERVGDILGLAQAQVDADSTLLVRLAHPDDRDEASRADAAMRQGESFASEYRIVRPDGDVRWIAVVGRPDHGVDGRARRIVGTIADITERKRHEQDLRENDRRKDEFLATLAHELRNPLAPIRNSLGVLRMMTGHGDSDHGRLHAIMDRQVTHMCRLVDDLLEVSRITRGKVELRKQRVELGRIIQSAVEISAPHVEQAGHQLEIDLEDDPLLVHGDPVRLAQVFANLLDNAVKYTDHGGQIRLAARREGDAVVVSIRDTGIGIAPEMLPHVFEMFSQVAGSRGGLGIGLTLVHRLVELHGGSASVWSDGLGKGTDVRVRLPLTHAAQAEAPCSTTHPASLSPDLRVLVVDDNRDAADSLAALLELLGSQAQVVYDGQRALESLDAFQPHVMLLDLGMPRMNGFELARRIRTHPRGSTVKLIALTGWGQADDRRRSTEAGFDHHLVKPVDTSTLAGLLAPISRTGCPG